MRDRAITAPVGIGLGLAARDYDAAKQRRCQRGPVQIEDEGALMVHPRRGATSAATLRLH